MKGTQNDIVSDKTDLAFSLTSTWHLNARSDPVVTPRPPRPVILRIPK